MCATMGAMINTDEEAERLYRAYKDDPEAAMKMRLDIRERLRERRLWFFFTVALPLSAALVAIILLIHYWS